MGGCFNYSRLTYTTIESNLGTFIDDMGANEPLIIESVENKQNIFSFGGFVNLKLGYKYVYVLPSFAFYRQNYGNYPYLLGGETFELKGWTFVPSLGVRVRLGKVKIIEIHNSLDHLAQIFLFQECHQLRLIFFHCQ